MVANVTLTPPAQAVGDVGVLWLDELVVNILAEEHGVAVATTVHNSLDKNSQVGGVCKQTSVTGDSTHGVVGLLVMDRTLNGIRAHVVKGNQAVASVAVKLGSCDSVSLEAVVQWVERDVLESQWLVESFLNVLVKAFIGNLLDDKTKKHVVYIGIGSLGAWDVLQRSLDNLLQNLIAILGVQLLVCVWLRIVRLLWVVVAVVILRIWWESSLVLKNLTNGKVILAQDLIALLVLEVWNVLLNLLGDVQLTVGNQLLNCQVSGIHLCVRSQVIEGIVVYSLAIFDARAIFVIRIDVTVVGLLDNLAVPSNNQLSRGKAVCNLCVDDLVNQLEVVVVGVVFGAVNKGWVANLDLKGSLSLLDSTDLQAVITVDGYVGDVNLVPGRTVKLVGWYLMAVYKERKALRLGALYIDGALTSKANKAVELVGNKRVVKGLVVVENREDLLVLEGSVYGVNLFCGSLSSSCATLCLAGGKAKTC